MFLVEIGQMLNEESLQNFSSSKFDWPWDGDFTEIDKANVWGHETSTSGGYSEHIFKYAAKELFDKELTNTDFKSLR